MDAEDLVNALNAHQVRYVLIGASAFAPHGFVRPTPDTNVFIEATAENAVRAVGAIQALGYLVITHKYRWLGERDADGHSGSWRG